MKKWVLKKVATILLASFLVSLISNFVVSPIKALAQFNNVIFTESSGKLLNKFDINGNAHTVTFDSKTSFTKTDDSGTIGYEFWRLSSSDYFTASNNFYLGFETIGLVKRCGIYTIATPAEIASGGTTMPKNGTTYYKKISTLDSTSLQNEYLNSINANPDFETIDASDVLFGSETFEKNIVFHGDDAPTITIDGDHKKGRPESTFTLTDDVNVSGGEVAGVQALGALGIFGGVLGFYSGKSLNNHIFFFTYSGDDPLMKGYAIKVFGRGFNAYVAKCDNTTSWNSCQNFTNSKVELGNLATLFQHIYNDPATTGGTTCGQVISYSKGGTNISDDGRSDEMLSSYAYTSKDVPLDDCLNTDSPGWLFKWDVKISNVTVTDPDGTGTACDNIKGHGTFGDALYKAFCNLAMMFASWADSMLKNAFCYLQISLGYTNSKSATWSSCSVPTSVSTGGGTTTITPTTTPAANSTSNATGVGSASDAWSNYQTENGSATGTNSNLPTLQNPTLQDYANGNSEPVLVSP